MDTTNPILDGLENLPKQSFAAGEYVLKEGKRTDRLYILNQGRVEVLQKNSLLYEISDRGSVFGEISALLDVDHTSTVRTLEPSTFYYVDGAPEFIRKSPKFALGLLQILARRLVGMDYLYFMKGRE